MLALKYLLMILGAGLFGSAGALVAYDIFLSSQLRRLLRRHATGGTGAEVGALAHRPFRPVRWRLALQLAAAVALAIRMAESVVVILGAAGVRVSQICGAQPGTLCPGVHIVSPLVDSAAVFDTREQVYSTSVGAEAIAEKAIRQLREFALTESCANGFRWPIPLRVARDATLERRRDHAHKGKHRRAWPSLQEIASPSATRFAPPG
jgi:hypothetical protein